MSIHGIKWKRFIRVARFEPSVWLILESVTLSISLWGGVEIMPHCIQMELHPMRTVEDIVAYLKERNIAIQAYSPLCRMIPEIRENEILKKIAQRTNKSVAQVILRWHIQNKTVPVFKSLKEKRLKENFDIFDFELTDEEMKAISSLDQDYKFHIESTSCPGY